MRVFRGMGIFMAWAAGLMAVVLIAADGQGAEAKAGEGTLEVKRLAKDLDASWKGLIEIMGQGSPREKALATWVLLGHRRRVFRFGSGRFDSWPDAIQLSRVLLESNDPEEQYCGLLWVGQILRPGYGFGQGETADEPLWQGLKRVQKEHALVSHRVLAAWILRGQTKKKTEEDVAFYQGLTVQEKKAFLEAMERLGDSSDLPNKLIPSILAEADAGVVEAGLRWLNSLGPLIFTEDQIEKLIARKHTGVRAQAFQVLAQGRIEHAKAAYLAVTAPETGFHVLAMLWVKRRIQEAGGRFGEWESRILGLLAHDKDEVLARQALILWAPYANKQAGFDLERAYRKALASNDPLLKKWAALVLAEFGAPPDPRQVAEALTDPDLNLRRLALRHVALFKEGDLLHRAFQALQTYKLEDIQGLQGELSQAWRALLDAGPKEEILKILTGYMLHSEPLGPTIAEALSGWRVEDKDRRLVPFFLPYLKDPAPETRVRLAQFSARILDRLGGLASLGSDPDEKVRMALLAAPTWSLAKETKLLNQLAKDPSLEVRKRLAGILRDAYRPEALAPLMTLADDSDAEVRALAVWPLLFFPDPAAERKANERAKTDRYPWMDARLANYDKQPFPSLVVAACFECCANLEDKRRLLSLATRQRLKGPLAGVVRQLVILRKELPAAETEEYRKTLNVNLADLTGLKETEVAKEAEIEKWLKEHAER